MDKIADKILNIKECAGVLHISISTLRKLIYERKISTFTIGNRYFFRESDIQSFIDNKVRRYL